MFITKIFSHLQNPISAAIAVINFLLQIKHLLLNLVLLFVFEKKFTIILLLYIKNILFTDSIE